MKLKALLYCTKGKPYLYYNWNTDTYHITNSLKDLRGDFGGSRVCSREDRLCAYQSDGRILTNGHIMAECDFEVEKIIEENRSNNFFYTKSLDNLKLEEKSCLNLTQLKEYLFKNTLLDKSAKGLEMFYKGYAIHIKNLYIFDKPRDLKEYDDVMANPLNKEPKNMMYAFKYFANLMNIQNQFQEYVIISTQPQEMCRIANKEQTVLVRRNILKDMLKDMLKNE